MVRILCRLLCWFKGRTTRGALESWFPCYLFTASRRTGLGGGVALERRFGATTLSSRAGATVLWVRIRGGFALEQRLCCFLAIG